jgi:NACHT domain
MIQSKKANFRSQLPPLQSQTTRKQKVALARVTGVALSILTLSTERKDIRQLRLLSPVRTKQKHDSLRRIGRPEDCCWMFSVSQFQEWLGYEYSAVLSCYGPREFLFCFSWPPTYLHLAGCGKTILASGVVEALKSSDLDDVEIAYYYCDHADKTSLDPAYILGALVRGLLRNYNIPGEVGRLIEQHYFDGKRTPETSEVFQVLMQTVCWFQNIILVIDGLEEVDEADRNTILRCLKTLISCPGLSVKLFITSREDQNILSILSPLPESSFRVRILETATSTNVENYVRESVDSMLPVVLSNASLKAEVIQTLITGAKGM